MITVRWKGRMQAYVLAAGSLAALLGGCAGPDPMCDRYAAQTSRPGWIVGDPIGMRLSVEHPEMVSYSSYAQPKSNIASVHSDD